MLICDRKQFINCLFLRHHSVCGCEESPDDGIPELGCGEGDTLLGCSYCSQAYHMKCIDLVGRKKSPRGTWACPACVMYAREKVKDYVVSAGGENDAD